MQDRHEVVLEANITGFKQKLKEATSISKTAGSKIKKDLDIDMSLFDYNSMTKQIVESDNAIKNLSVNFDKLNKNMVLTKTSLGTTSSGLEKISNESKKVEINTNGMEKAWTKGLKSVKKLTIGFLGARTAFGLFRRYMSEYSRENEEFANKMQLTTSIVANTLAPVFEWFANILQYAAIGLARIIELLTGVNILGKATDNAFKGAAKSAKEFNDNLSGLDEISNISESQGGLSTGIGSQLNALNEFQNKIKEVDEWLERTGIKKFFEDLRPVIKDVFGWISEHPLGALGILGAFELLKISIPSILGVSGGTFGLFGIATALTIIAGINVANIISEIKDLKKITDETITGIDNLIDRWKILRGDAPETIEEFTPEEVAQTFSTWDSQVDASITNIERKLDDLGEYSWVSKNISWNIWHGQFKEDEKLLDSYIQSMLTMISYQNAAYEQGKLTSEQEEEYKNNLIKSIDAMKKAKRAGYDYNKELSETESKLNKLQNKKVSATIEIKADTWQANQDINNLKTNLSSLVMGNMSSTIQGMISALGKNGWGFADGGFVGEGQMFVAREAGPELVGTISGHTAVMNNDQIVASVSAGVYQAVASAMGGQSDRPIILNIDGREFAKVTYADYQAESSRRGTNTALRRY